MTSAPTFRQVNDFLPGPRNVIRSVKEENKGPGRAGPDLYFLSSLLFLSAFLIDHGKDFGKARCPFLPAEFIG